MEITKEALRELGFRISSLSKSGNCQMYFPSYTDHNGVYVVVNFIKGRGPIVERFDGTKFSLDVDTKTIEQVKVLIEVLFPPTT